MKLTYEIADKMTKALLAHRGVEVTDLDIQTDAVASATYKAALLEVRTVAGVLPDTAGIDFVRLMETWTEEGTNLTATLLDMAISVMLVKRYHVTNPGEALPPRGLSAVITSADLRTIAEQYHWERHEEAGTWTIRLQKISEMSSETVDT